MRSELLKADDTELRRSRRFPIAAPLRYRISRQTDWRRARTENISSTGVLFRCEECADRGERLEMNFLLLRSSTDQAGLEVACAGEVVRMDIPLGEDKLPALAVNFTAYRLGPGINGRWGLDSPLPTSGNDE
jgi:hypothetical protein